MEKLKCQSCGSTNLQSQDGILVCDYCGVSHSPKTETNENSRKLSKLDIANHWARVYFEEGSGAVIYGTESGFEAVIKYYGEAELDGGVEQVEYYLNLSRFVVKGKLKGYEEGTIPLRSRQKFKDYYKFLMSSALLYATENQKQEIAKERDETLAVLEIELAKYKEEKVKVKKRKKSWLDLFGLGDAGDIWDMTKGHEDILKDSLSGYDDILKDSMKAYEDALKESAKVYEDALKNSTQGNNNSTQGHKDI